MNLRRGVLLLVIAALVAGGGWWLRERAARTAPPGGPAPVAGAPATSTAAPASGSAPGATSGSGAGSEAAAAMGVIEFAPGDLATLAPVTLERQIPLTGTLRAVHQTLVRAKVAGELLSLSVREGDTVRAGQPIARIDPADFEARVREREAQARSAETQLEQARRTLENNRQLLTRGFISQNAFDNAQSGADVA
ncbi:MAG TPA: biotin/lipoyl-binding protein, partial [Quisquiliibacterium sp.]|nr:biotin/lipoyl-binding protein [Quisquiliibacterium sp.]